MAHDESDPEVEDQSQEPGRFVPDRAAIAAELVQASRPVGWLMLIAGFFLANGLVIEIGRRGGSGLGAVFVGIASLLGCGVLARILSLGLRAVGAALQPGEESLVIRSPAIPAPDPHPIPIPEPEPEPESEPVPAPTLHDGRVPLLADFRKALREEDWDTAEAAGLLFQERYGDDAIRPLDELEAARAGLVDRLRAALEAAKAAGDPARILELRLAIAPHLAAGAREELDRDLAGFLIRLIQRRLLGGTIGPDVPELAVRVGETFAHTREGASLLASLPTLRRSAGLCPRCGKPFVGIEDACPACLAAAQRPAARIWPSDEDDEDEEETEEEPRHPENPPKTID